MHLLPITPGPLIIWHLALGFSSELSPQSLLPFHLLKDGIHFLELAHLNSVEEHCTEMEEKGYVHALNSNDFNSLTK